MPEGTTSSSNTLLRCLIADSIEPLEKELAHKITPHVVPLEEGVEAFVYRARSGTIHIFANSNLSDIQKIALLCHELKHVIKNIPCMGHAIRFDMQHIEVDHFVRGNDGTQTMD
jgi:hypothetical protein